MARTVDEIKQRIYDQIALKPSLALLVNNPSQVAVFKDFIHCIALEIGVHEQLIDEFKAETETKVNRAAVHNFAWVKQKALEFQYDATTPQILQLVDFVPAYVPVDITKRIISNVCLRFNGTRVLSIIVAKSSPPQALTAPELASIQSYFTDGGSSTDYGIGVGAAGIAHDLISLDPDYVFVEGTIKYNGQYTSTIKADVINAIEAYLHNPGPKGTLKTLSLVDAIQSVTGVNDINLVNLAIRANGDFFSGPDQKVYLIQASAILSTEEEMVSGYAYQEVTTGNTFLDKITFTVG